MVKRLDEGLSHIGGIIKRDLGRNVGSLPGGGAAGGMGAGMAAFLGSPLVMGIEAVLDTVKFDGMLNGADLVLTGEGKLDAQSLRGKAVIGISRRARAAGVPVVAIVGGYDSCLDGAYSEGVSAVFSISRLPEPLSVSGPKTKENFSLTVRNILRLLNLKS
jgi:glycerate kinase